MQTADALRRSIAAQATMLARIEAYGSDIYEDGNVLLFDRTFNDGKTYSYAMIKAEGLWYTTGPRSPKGYSWDQIVAWLVDGDDEPVLYRVTKITPVAEDR